MLTFIKSILARERILLINLAVSTLLPLLQLVLYFFYDNDVYGQYILFMAIVQLQIPLISLKSEFSFTKDVASNKAIAASITKHLYGNLLPIVLIELLLFYVIFDFALLDSAFGLISIFFIPGYLFCSYFLMFSGKIGVFFMFKVTMPVCFILLVTLDLLVIGSNSLIELAMISHVMPFVVLLIVDTKTAMLFLPRLSHLVLFHFDAIKERWRYLSASMLDNLSLYFPVFVISKLFNLDVVGQFGYITRVLLLPQVVLSQPASAHIQLVFAQKRERFISQLFKISLVGVCLYFVLFSTVSYLISDIIETYVPMLSGEIFYLIFALILSYSLKVVVNPLSVVLYVKKEDRKLQLSQFVLFSGELIASVLAFFVVKEYYEYLLVQSLIATLAYSFYYFNIFTSLKKHTLSVAKAE